MKRMFAMMKRAERVVLKVVQSVLMGMRNLLSSRPMQLVPKELLEWMTGDYTGASSKTIAHVLSDVPQATVCRGYTPSDSADFGRCVKLLEIFPEWHDRLPEVAAAYPNSCWEPVVARWDELARLWYATNYRECTRTLQDIHEARAAALRPEAVKDTPFTRTTDYSKSRVRLVK